MRRRINISFLVNETGFQNSRNLYICKACKRRANSDQVEKEKWYYKINEKEENLVYLKKNGIGYVPFKKVVYICYKHYKILSEKKASQFVQVGMPYFLSIIGKKGGILSF